MVIDLVQKRTQFCISLKSLEQVIKPCVVPFTNSDFVRLHGSAMHLKPYMVHVFMFSLLQQGSVNCIQYRELYR